MGHRHHPHQVDGNRRLVLSQWHLREPAAVHHPGVVDQYINPAALLVEPVPDGFDLIRLRHIEGVAEHLPTCLG